MTTRIRTKCHAIGCGAPLAEHIAAQPGDPPEQRKCPNGSGRLFRKHVKRKGAASQSFSAEEVGVLSDILTGLVRRADLTHLARTKPFVSIANKVAVMRSRSKADRSTEGAK